jgi:hypothetical protein
VIEIGQIFGEWKVIRASEEKIYNRRGWICACSCGLEQLVSQVELLRGKTKKCRSCSSKRNWNKFREENSVEHLFWKKVEKKTEDECWNWTGGSFRRGYGAFHVGSQMVKAHRYSYELANGEFDKSLRVLHSCDNPSCENPKHLLLGTDQDNSDDMISKNRHYKGENHHSAKLTEDLVREIRKLHQEGVSQNELAQRYNIRPKAINYIVNRKTWKHVD